MNVMVSLPEELAARFGSEAELNRHVLELLALDGYKAGRLTRAELRQVLGYATRAELEAFLSRHYIEDGMTLPDFEQDLHDMERAGL